MIYYIDTYTLCFLFYFHKKPGKIIKNNMIILCKHTTHILQNYLPEFFPNKTRKEKYGVK